MGPLRGSCPISTFLTAPRARAAHPRPRVGSLRSRTRLHARAGRERRAPVPAARTFSLRCDRMCHSTLACLPSSPHGFRSPSCAAARSLPRAGPRGRRACGVSRPPRSGSCAGATRGAACARSARRARPRGPCWGPWSSRCARAARTRRSATARWATTRARSSAWAHARCASGHCVPPERRLRDRPHPAPGAAVPALHRARVRELRPLLRRKTGPCPADRAASGYAGARRASGAGGGH